MTTASVALDLGGKDHAKVWFSSTQVEVIYCPGNATAYRCLAVKSIKDAEAGAWLASFPNYGQLGGGSSYWVNPLSEMDQPYVYEKWHPSYGGDVEHMAKVLRAVQWAICQSKAMEPGFEQPHSPEGWLRYLKEPFPGLPWS